MKNIEINKTTPESKDYPVKLRNISSVPKELYYLGNLEILKSIKVLAIVGTRNATSYGKKVLRTIVPELCTRNIVIVSGLALGIDIFAHKLVLENGGKAVAVLAGGLDIIYPFEHESFANDIVQSGGLLLSEHGPGTRYLRQYFPARNRIISGLSDATLVIEAKKKSGALITADFAFSQKRQVFAVPGNIYSPQSQGVNGLFDKGALPVQDSNDIFKFFFPRKKFSRKSGLSKNQVNQADLNLSKEQNIVYDLVPSDYPIAINTLIRKAKLPSAKVIAAVTQLEVMDLIENDSNTGYVKVI